MKKDTGPFAHDRQSVPCHFILGAMQEGHSPPSRNAERFSFSFSWNSSMDREKIWDFFHTSYLPSSSLGFSGRKQRPLTVVFTSLSRVNA